jgi:uncharacterized protein with PIN domain
MEEIWKPIDQFPNYNVSNLGNIKNIITNKLLKLNCKDGYCNISLVNDEIRKGFKVHRLVALAFIENPENKSDVNHKDKNKINNQVSNLEWMTRKENNIHRCKDLIITTNKNKPIFRIDKNTNEILEKYNSIEDAAIWAFNNELTKNIHNGRNAIGNCITGLSKISYGFKWSLEPQVDYLEGEIWKQVPNTIKTYWVSNLGRFKNFFGVIMDNYKKTVSGYISVGIDNITYRLHRIVALTFIENPENKEQVNHIDGNKTNNAVSNLEWVTNQENQIHKFKTGLGNNFTRKIGQYDLEHNLIKEFSSIAGAAKELNIGTTNIGGVCKNMYKQAGGFIFKYLD